METTGRGVQRLRLVAQGLSIGLCQDQWGSSEQVEVLEGSGTGMGAFTELCRGRNRKDSMRRHLGILSELNCSQNLLLLLQPGCTQDYFTSCRTVYFVFRFCGGLMQWALGDQDSLAEVMDFLIAEVQTGDSDTTATPTSKHPLHYPLINTTQLSWGFYKLQLLALQ